MFYDTIAHLARDIIILPFRTKVTGFGRTMDACVRSQEETKQNRPGFVLNKCCNLYFIIAWQQSTTTPRGNAGPEEMVAVKIEVKQKVRKPPLPFGPFGSLN